MEVAATEQFRLLQQAKTMSHAFVRTKLPPLVPEYATVISAWHAPTTVPFGQYTNASFQAEDDHGLAIMVPKQARLLQRPLRGGGEQGDLAEAESCRHVWGVHCEIL